MLCILLNEDSYTYVFASVLTEGSPSNTTTRSAKYVAIMKSCSTTKAVFFACKMNLEWRKMTGENDSLDINGEETWVRVRFTFD